MVHFRQRMVAPNLMITQSLRVPAISLPVAGLRARCAERGTPAIGLRRMTHHDNIRADRASIVTQANLPTLAFGGAMMAVMPVYGLMVASPNSNITKKVLQSK